MEKVIDLADKRKIQIKKNLIRNVQESMKYILDGLMDLLLLDDESELFDVMNQCVCEIDNLYGSFNDTININLEEYIYKLKIISEISYYFVLQFEIIYTSNEIDYYQLKYCVLLAEAYIKYIRFVLNNKYDYMNTNVALTISLEEKAVMMVVNELEHTIKREAYLMMLSEIVVDELGSDISPVDIDIISNVMDKIVNQLLEYDSDIIKECFLNILYLYKKKDISSETLGLDNYIDGYINYYKANENIDNLVILVNNYMIDTKKKKNIVNNLNEVKKILVMILKDEQQFFKLRNIEFIIKGILDKLVSLIDLEDVQLLDEYGSGTFEMGLKNVINDKNVYNTITTIILDLLKYVNSKEENYLDGSDFNYIWCVGVSHVISNQLSGIVKRDMLNGYDNEFYANQYYRKIIHELISQLSGNIFLDKLDDICIEEVEKQFMIRLNIIKNSFTLEETVKLYGLTTILSDMKQLDYYNITYTSKYIGMLDGIFSKLKYGFNLHDFLAGASYYPQNIKYNNKLCVSLYNDDKINLVFDGNKYYVIDKENIVFLNIACVDSLYSNKNTMYDLVLKSIILEYDNGVKKINENGRSRIRRI